MILEIQEEAHQLQEEIRQQQTEILQQEEVRLIPQGQEVNLLEVNLLEVPLQQEEILTVIPLREVQIILQVQQEVVQQEVAQLEVVLAAVHLRLEEGIIKILYH